MKTKFNQSNVVSEVLRIAKGALVEVADGEDALRQIANEDKRVVDKRHRFLSPDYNFDLRTGVKTAVSRDNPFSKYGEKTGIDDEGLGGSIGSKVRRKMNAFPAFDNENIYIIDTKSTESNINYRIIGATGSNQDSECDLVRNSFMLGKHEHILSLVDIIFNEIGAFWGELVHHPERGYRGDHMSANQIPGLDGLCAELQIGTPLQSILNDITHSFSYVNTRSGELDPEKQAILDRASREIYNCLWDSDAKFETTDQQTRAKIITLCRRDPRFNDRDKIIASLKKEDKLLQFLKATPLTKMKANGIYLVDNDLLAGQAQLAQLYAQPRQQKLNKWCEYIFRRYEALDKSGKLAPNLTEGQQYVVDLFKYAIKDRIDEFHAAIKSGQLHAEDAEEYFRTSYGNVITDLQNRIVMPIYDSLYGH